MALRWLEGFDPSNDETYYERFYETFTGNIGSFSDGMFQGSLSSVDSADGFTLVSKNLLSSGTQNTWIIGFAFRSGNNADTIEGSSPNFNKPSVGLHNDDGEQIRLEMFDDANNGTKPGGDYYRIRVVRGSTTLATADQRFWLRNDEISWTYFEWKVTIDNSAGTFSLRYFTPKSKAGVQTATWDSATSGLDTQEQSTAGANRFGITADNESNANSTQWDDIYVCDDTGTKNNDFLGPIVIERQRVNGDGTTTDWDLLDAADTEEAWDESNLVDDDPRVTTDVTSDVHLATLTALSHIRNTSVIGVRLQHTANRQSAAGTVDLAFRWRKTTGTPAETDGGTYSSSTTTWSGESDVQEDDPNTGTDFVIADIDAMEVGVRNATT